VWVAGGFGFASLPVRVGGATREVCVDTWRQRHTHTRTDIWNSLQAN